MSQFDQFANQGGPAQTPDEIAEARRVAEDQLRNADYSGDLPDQLGRGRHAADAPDDAETDADAGSNESDPPSSPSPDVV